MPAPNASTPTFAQLMTLTMGLEHIPLQARRDMCSAVRSFAKVAGQSPGDIIADPAVVRSLTARAPWQLADHTKARWGNILSNLSRIMQCCDINVDRQRRNYSVSPEWKALLAPLTRRDHDELRRFSGWCSVRSIAPPDVTPATFDQFLQYMLAQSMQRNPRERAHVPRRAWNRAVATPGTVYPLIPAPALPGQRAMRWTDFPKSLQDEIGAYSAQALKISEIYDDNRPIKAVTLGNYLASIRVLLSVLIDGGMCAEQFTSLRQVIDPVVVRRGMDLRLNGRKLDNGTRQDLHRILVATLNVGRFLAIDSTHRAALCQLEKKVRFVAKGMNEKNKARLRVLLHPTARTRLLRLPIKVAHDLGDLKIPTVRQAQRMQLAVLFEILLHVPMRIRNAAELDLAATISPPVAGLHGKWRISIPADEVKNLVAIDAELGEVTSALLARYVQVFRPRLAHGNSTRLFLGQSGKGKGPSPLSKQLAKFVYRETGITIHAHLMRHLAAHLYLAANPGQYHGVRKLLGHKDVQTAIRNYTGLESDQAIATYDALVGRLRAEDETEPVRRSRRIALTPKFNREDRL